MTKIDDIINKQGIRLDIGGGHNPQPGFTNIDILPLKEVDIVWDIETTPWQIDGQEFPSESVSIAMASHALEHINPAKGTFVKVMNEIWRILKPGGQFAFVVPYAESFGMYQDPTHCNFINEATMLYFCPFDQNGNPSPLYGFYQPNPWKIEKMPFSRQGVLECLLTKIPMDKSYLGKVNPSDITQEKFDVKTIRNT